MMQVHRNLEQLPPFKNAVITIGTFDGVHLGHQQIIRQLKETARENDGETVIITFHPHPRKIVGVNGKDISLLNTLNEKIELLDKAGIHHLVVVPFTEDFANLSAEAYCKDFLYRYFKPKTVIIGYDHRFGKNRSGDYHLLEKMGIELGFEVKEISEQILNEVTVSSTRIRNALMNHDINTANQFLGYRYFFEGIVVKGNQLGRTIGFATANLEIEVSEKLIPADGVYAVGVIIKNHPKLPLKQMHDGMMNIGIRPTVDGTKKAIEVHIFNFNEDIYDYTIQVCMLNYLRGEVKFSNIEMLTKQLQLDAENAKKEMASNR